MVAMEKGGNPTHLKAEYKLTEKGVNFSGRRKRKPILNIGTHTLM